MFGDDDEKEGPDWSPDKERSQEERLDRILSMAEKQMKGLMGERPAAPVSAGAYVARRVAPVGFMPMAQIQIRMIENGFVMSYFRADPVPGNHLGIELYNPTQVEVYVSGSEEGAVQLAKAMEDALKLSRSAKAYREHLEGPPDTSPPAVASGEDAPIPDL